MVARAAMAISRRSERENPIPLIVLGQGGRTGVMWAMRMKAKAVTDVQISAQRDVQKRRQASVTTARVRRAEPGRPGSESIERDLMSAANAPSGASGEDPEQ